VEALRQRVEVFRRGILVVWGCDRPGLAVIITEIKVVATWGSGIWVIAMSSDLCRTTLNGLLEVLVVSEERYRDINEKVSDSSEVPKSSRGGVGVHCAAAAARHPTTVCTSGRKEQLSFQHSSTVAHTGSLKPIA
jgi:hypothetical protein